MGSEKERDRARKRKWTQGVLSWNMTLMQGDVIYRIAIRYNTRR